MLALFSLGVLIQNKRPVISEVAKTNATPHPTTPMIETGHDAGPISENPAHSAVNATLNGSIANDPLVRSAQHIGNNTAPKRLVDEVPPLPGSTPSVSAVNRNRVAQSKFRELGSYEVQEGDTLEARFIGVDRKNRIVTLSVKAKEIQEEEETVAEYSRNASTGKTSLGDLLKEQIGGNDR